MPKPVIALASGLLPRSFDPICMRPIILLDELQTKKLYTDVRAPEFCQKPKATPICPWPVIFVPLSSPTYQINCAAWSDPLPNITFLWNGEPLDKLSHSVGLHVNSTKIDVNFAEISSTETSPATAVLANVGLVTCVAETEKFRRTMSYLLYYSPQTSMKDPVKEIRIRGLPDVFLNSSTVNNLVECRPLDSWPCTASHNIVQQQPSSSIIPAETHPLFIKWLHLNQIQRRETFLRRQNHCADTARDYNLFQETALIPTSFISLDNSWNVYPDRLAIACYPSSGCIHQTFIYDTPVEYAKLSRVEPVHDVIVGTLAAVMFAMLTLICFGFGIRRALLRKYSHDRMKSKLIRRILGMRKSEESNSNLRYYGSHSFLMQQSISNCPVADRLNHREIVHVVKKRRQRAVSSSAPCCPNCALPHSTRSYENLNMYRTYSSLSEESRYASSLPSLNDNEKLLRTVYGRSHRRDPSEWGQVVNGVWDIDPQRLRLSRTLGSGAFGRVMQARLTLPSVDANICSHLREQIFRVTGTTVKLTNFSSPHSLWVAVKEVFFNDSRQCDFSDHETVQLNYPPTVSSRLINPPDNICVYAELASASCLNKEEMAKRSRQSPAPKANPPSGNLNKSTDSAAVPLIRSGPYESIIPKYSKSPGFRHSSVNRVQKPQINPLLEAELAVMKAAGIHPNVVTLIGRCTFPGLGPVLVIEYCPHGSLRAYLRSMRGNLSQEEAEMPELQKQLLQFVCQIAEGMTYLGSRNIIHRDLAARNILLSVDWVCKISDFGLSKLLDPNTEYYLRDRGALPMKWLAPEVLNTKKFSRKSDVWSFGVLLWEVYTLGGIPYMQFTLDQVRDLIQRGYRMSKPLLCPPYIGYIMQETWNTCPEDRPDFAQIAKQINQFMLSK
ncbi:unnamed protein product [Calicophoron daubneyi]|uniref:Protein kinase domain-containing protein n=1 Tax=Calicophoron daubneyi TaxID=300641 RepID=A0AAV2TXR6_CALDB